VSTLFVIPAKAGIQYSTTDSIAYWIPACAGMTRGSVPAFPTKLIPLQAFNSRDIDGALSVMRADVVWANGMEGGFVYGHEAVREYGTRQWQQIDPRVEPRHFESQGNRLVVDVHQIVRDMNGGVLVDQMTKHVFTIDAGVISKCEIG